ncbi:MAG: purine-binding chemotaxis protein CheW [Deltaproteobacteria bacterium]|nr:purine-binding chemotaxis protein CheW [Deltaproteobacteria bacterium]
MEPFVVFSVDDVRYGVPASSVLEIAPRVEILPLPAAPSGVLGVIRYRGSLAVVVDVRRRFGHPPRAASMDDHLLVASARGRVLALLVDRVEGIRDIDPTTTIDEGVTTAAVDRVLALPDRLVLIADLERALSLEDEAAIRASLGSSGLDRG